MFVLIKKRIIVFSFQRHSFDSLIAVKINDIDLLFQWHSSENGSFLCFISISKIMAEIALLWIRVTDIHYFMLFSWMKITA